MLLLGTAAATALITSLVLTVLIRRFALRMGIVDHPDGKRKTHPQPVSLWGGLAVYLGLCIGLVLANFGTFGTGMPLAELSVVLVLVAGVVCLVGAIDDYCCLNARFKLLLQILAVLPIVAFGYYIDRVVAFGHPLELGWLGVPLTVLWLVGCINSLNLLDGMDGLASTIGLLTAAMMSVIAHSMGNDHVAVIAVVLAASLAGFLSQNLPPAKIFLGDSGSMVIGLVVGVMAMQGAMKTSATLAITVPAVMMSLPMFDTLLALTRRKLTGRRFDAADREHIHHRLLDRGWNQWQVLCVIGALSLAMGGAATAATIFRSDALACVTAFGLIALVVRLRLFGHHEINLVQQALRRRLADFIQRLGGHTVAARLWNDDTLADLPFEEAWKRLTEEAVIRRVCRLELILLGEGHAQRRHDWINPAMPTQGRRSWSVAITFPQRGGRICELRASGAEPMEPEIHTPHGITAMLKRYGDYFNQRVGQFPRLATLDSDATQIDWQSSYDHKAA